MWPISIWIENMLWHIRKCRISRLDNVWWHNIAYQCNYHFHVLTYCLIQTLKSILKHSITHAITKYYKCNCHDSSKQTPLLPSYLYWVHNVLHNSPKTWRDTLNILQHFRSLPFKLFVHLYALLLYSYMSLYKPWHLHTQLNMLHIQARHLFQNSFPCIYMVIHLA